MDNKGNVIRGETKELLRLLKQNIIEEELRVDEEERKRLQEEGRSSLCLSNCLSSASAVNSINVKVTEIRAIWWSLLTVEC